MTSTTHLYRTDEPHDRTSTSRRSRISRFVVVTAVATPVNFAVYLWLLRTTSWTAFACNLAAASLITPPTFIVNRTWVWSRRSGSAMRELVRYWSMTALNVGCASAALAAVQRYEGRGPVVAATPLATYTLLWVARFAYLDARLFRPG